MLDDGSLKCWGQNSQGQLGIGSTTSQTTPQTVDLGTGRTAVSVSLGYGHTCAVLDDGSLKCWGQNYYGQLGIASTTQQTTPQTVDLGTGRTAVSVSLGGAHTCAVLDDGTLKCWGHNSQSQLGLGSTTTQTTPQTVTLGTGRTAVLVSLGTYNTCAVLDDGTLKCWGQNSYGQLGSSISNAMVLPVLLGRAIPTPIQSVSLGQYHTCAVLDDGSLKCWGQNYYGQLGIGSTTQQTTPQTVDLGTGRTAVSVSLGGAHTCAVLDDGTLKCWGHNNYGQLGIGSTTQQTTPQTVDLGTGRTAVSVSSGSSHTCAVLDDGSLKCWGRNSLGQLGIGSTTQQTTPQTVDLGTGRTAVSVSLGYGHTCAVLDDGSLKCWGYNYYGELGIGSTTQQTTPQTVTLGTGRTAVSVSLGQYHTCAVLDDGSLKCWGDNSHGQLGLGSTTTQTTPQNVTLGTGRTAVSVSLGQYHTCAVLDDGSLKCWGKNSQGQLGLGSTTSQTTPQTVDLGTGRTAVSVSLGYGHTCAVLDDGSRKCWGHNSYGQLGIGSLSYVYVPQIEGIFFFTYNPYFPLFVTDSNSWHGIPKEIGLLNLDVWYNTSSSTNFHRIQVNISPTITYSADSFVFTINQSTSITPTGFSCEACTLSISPQLPQGMEFNSSNAVISGTPTEVTFNKTYTVSTQNYSGYWEVPLSLEIVDNIPEISTTSTSLHFIKGFRNQSNDLSNIGGSITSSSLDPSIVGLLTNNGNNENLLLNSNGVCSIVSSGLNCWGDDFTHSPDTFFPYNQSAIIDVSLSPTNVCVVNSNSDVKCMGEHNYGQINGSIGTNDSLQFIEATFSSTVPIVQVATSMNEICVLDAVNDLFCQGSSDYSISQHSYGQITQLDSGDSHFCILTIYESLYCWGNNQNYAIGTGQSATGTETTIPVMVDLGTGYTALDFDTGQKHTCAVRNDGSILCWGTGTSGSNRQWIFSKINCHPQIVDSPSWASYSNVSVGYSHTCAMVDEGGIMCWGDNSHGQLGDGTTINRLSPVNVTIIPSWMNAVDVFAGSDGTCVVDELGGIWCWGDNSGQKLGLNSTIQTATTPQPVRFTHSSALVGAFSMGALTGAPLASQPMTIHRLYTNNSGGSDDVNITITVGIAADYPNTQLNLVRNTSNLNISPTLSGGPYQFSVHPSLPLGMYIGGK